MTTLKARLRQGQAITMIGNSLPDTYAAEMVASAGFDAVMIDLQHSAIGLHEVNDLARAVRAQGCAPVVRVAANDPAAITKVLDGGVDAVVAPMINSAEACRQFISACYYAPLGDRSFGPYLGQVIQRQSIQDYYAQTRDRLLPIAMIENEEGVRQAERIMRTEGLGAIYVGASDLSIAMGMDCVPDYRNARLLDCIKGLIDLGERCGIPVGAFAPTLEDSLMLKSLGARILWVGSDQGFIKAGCAARAQQYHAESSPRR
ncbi:MULTISPECIES: HpcH/HpaI aldolase family protein [Bordetella]|uniref:Aldolase n=1 Tax=Bordetella genomosp. 6 TaxID=463024 RepID=A0ABX4FAL1_9BORD|nr:MULTISPECIES: aldolase/citrate lyase family protein [Bordetella]AOB24836.1 aldolase [Bordetella bronchiseptica]ARP78961.1 aldolase [Bordetella genomosp. 6]AZW42069.1 aldolase [Bordetella bronchiseptica]KCV63842.1 HpcH/HpaI aldolase/citrate lyase family protein [Bordetella bronchiseptica 99-R-0433]MBN3267401.1 aldolase [Bordetella bronchiseptica]